MHYPMLSWPKKNSGSIHLHGHIHARQDYNLKNREEGILRYDVGVDANQYMPVSLQQILSFFDGTEPSGIGGMTLREYKEKHMGDPEFARAYEEM